MTPKVQQATIDVAMWSPDPEFKVFPQGAREKFAVFAPQTVPDPVLVPDKRYLFKLSRRAYVDQFWAEVVAYRVGCLLDLEVPPAFGAIHSLTGQSGALIEWFYNDGEHRFVLAGDRLQGMRPDFERARGESHNMDDNILLLRQLAQHRVLMGDWRQWWADALAFDALIGNTDRHQDNWGFIYSQAMPSLNKCWIAPLFDNGTSLGSELFTDRAQEWDDKRLSRYIDRGTHHLRWPANECLHQPDRGHFKLLQRALDLWPATREVLKARFDGMSREVLEHAIGDLPHYQLPVRYRRERLSLTIRLLSRRLDRIKDLL
jgi:HipA-like C-terminal domain